MSTTGSTATTHTPNISATQNNGVIQWRQPEYGVFTPYITVKDCLKAIDFYTRAFGAKQVDLILGGGGGGGGATDGEKNTKDQAVMHAEIELPGDKPQRIFLSDEMEQMNLFSPVTLKGTPISLVWYVPNVDETFERAVSTGVCKIGMPITNMFWGDRCGMLTDPYGHKWTIATTKEIVPEALLQTRFLKMFEKSKEQIDAECQAGGPRPGTTVFTDDSSSSLKSPSYLPPGYAPLTPFIVVRRLRDAAEWYQTNFGAKLVWKLLCPSGLPNHDEWEKKNPGMWNMCELNIDGTSILLCGENEMCGYQSAEKLGGTPINMMFSVQDPDTMWKRVLAAGAVEKRPLMDQFYGERQGELIDPFGIKWTIGCHNKDVSKAEIQAIFASFASHQPSSCPGQKEQEKKTNTNTCEKKD